VPESSTSSKISDDKPGNRTPARSRRHQREDHTPGPVTRTRHAGSTRPSGGVRTPRTPRVRFQDPATPILPASPRASAAGPTSPRPEGETRSDSPLSPAPGRGYPRGARGKSRVMVVPPRSVWVVTTSAS
jgi:hypothetical protein